MKKFLLESLRLLRPRQWVKNLAIYAALLFSRQLFDPQSFINVTLGFIAFCSISSAIYVINDILDVEKDRRHPFKRFRPLASRTLSVQYAIFLAVALIIFSFLLSFSISFPLLLLIIAFLFLQFLYSFLLKQLAIMDIMILATGYIIRVYGGELITGHHISVWLFLTTISLALFLAVGKRRRELTLISGYTSTQIASIRKSLSHYSENLLDMYAAVFATSAFIMYALFTSSASPQITNNLFLPDFLPQQFQRKWLMITILPVVYGLMRYLQDIYEKHEGESPEKVLFTDKQLLATVLVWVVLVITIVYGLQYSPQ